jgi:peptidoglycan/LPS O-acetylase OafA/YrhL
MTGNMLTAPSNDSSTRTFGGSESRCIPCAAEFAGQKSHKIRLDIEGLRAVAVVSVLMNHAFPGMFPGGFAGVDIFFVISGYLIGRHLLQDIQAARLSILGFYARRARRIFPALALLLISVWCVGWFILSAPEFAALGWHMIAATFFSNNFLLSSESGYFDASALAKPLLHLWSLGIEEQFYLLVPTMLWIGSKGTSGSVRWVARLGALSFLATIFLSDFDYISSFYLLHTRFWELGAGVVLAQAELLVHAQLQQQCKIQWASRRDILEIQLFCSLIAFTSILALGGSRLRWGGEAFLRDGGLLLTIVACAATAFLADRYARAHASNHSRSWFVWPGTRLGAIGSLAGMVLISASVATLTSTNWPGAQTIFPVLGTALVIASSPTEPINRLLGWRPLASIGGFSYPLYLWHWPAIVVFRMLRPEPSTIEMAIPLGTSFALAWMTKKFLEDPVRFGKLGSMVFRRPPLRPVVLGLALAGLLGSSAVTTDGLPSRLSPRLRAVGEWSEVNPDVYWRAGRCYLYLGYPTSLSRECTPAKRPGIPLILLWGDSHAAHLYPGMVDLQSARTFDIAQSTAAACPPTVIPVVGESDTCAARRADSMSRLAQINPDIVVMAGAWERYVEISRAPDQIIGAVSETIRSLKKSGSRRIIVFGPGPLWTTSLPSDLFRFMVRSRSKEIPERLGRVSDVTWRLDASFAALAAAENVQYVSILNILCNTEGCLTVGDKTLQRPDLLFRDRDHLTVSGSKLLIAGARLQLFGAN